MIDRKEYLLEYHKTKLKRVPLDLPISKYEEIKAHTQERSESVNGFIKRAIEEQMKRDRDCLPSQ